jgi:hypothetical protein
MDFASFTERREEIDTRKRGKEIQRASQARLRGIFET